MTNYVYDNNLDFLEVHWFRYDFIIFRQILFGR